MIAANFEQLTGTIDILTIRFDHEYKQTEFEKDFAKQFNTIDKDSATQYSLREPIFLFDEEFRLTLHFEKNILNNCIFQLISGPARTMGEYPSRVELQVEVDYLVHLFSHHCTGKHTTQYPWRHSWLYPWGDLTVLLHPQNLSVITDLSWNTRRPTEIKEGHES